VRQPQAIARLTAVGSKRQKENAVAAVSTLMHAASPNACRWKQSNKTQYYDAIGSARALFGFFFSLHQTDRSLSERKKRAALLWVINHQWPAGGLAGGRSNIHPSHACRQRNNVTAITRIRAWRRRTVRDQLLCSGRVPPALRTVLSFSVNYT